MKTYLFIQFLSAFTFSYAQNTTTGCTDEQAVNYNVNAVTDDNSCIHPLELGDLECGERLLISDSITSLIGGGMTNYYTLFIEDNSTIYFNLNSDNPSTRLLIFDENHLSVSTTTQINLGSFQRLESVNLVSGEYYLVINTKPNYTPQTLFQYYSYTQNDTTSLSSYNISILSYNKTCVSIGCTDEYAINYESEATHNNGSCEYLFLSIDTLFVPEFCTLNTGSNMTLFLSGEFVNSIPEEFQNGYIAAISESNMVVGSTQISSLLEDGMGTVAIWGNDNLTPGVDGAFFSDVIYLQLVDSISLFDVITESSQTLISFEYNTNDLIVIDEPIILAFNNNFGDDPADSIIMGCTDWYSINYNPLANFHENSCRYDYILNNYYNNCNVQSYQFNEQTYYESGVYLQFVEQDDSIFPSFVSILDLTIHYIAHTYQSLAICYDSTYEIAESVYSTSGTYVDAFETLSGCESIIVTYLTVYPENIINQEYEIDFGDSVSVGTNTYFESGFYIDHLNSSFGCDSQVVTSLEVFHTLNQGFIICEGDEIEVNSNYIDSEGYYIDTVEIENQNDSIFITSIMVNDNPPIPEISQTFSSTISTGDFDAYQWYRNNELLIGETNQTLNISQLGNYSVEVFNEFNCSTFSDYFGIGTLDLELFENDEFVLYPNPVNEYVNLFIPKEHARHTTIEIHDMIGKLVFTKQITNSQQRAFSLLRFKSGIYKASVIVSDKILWSQLISKN